ncbi:MAG: flagellar basal body P-ring formation chaperone FlgA [Verrucomicrobiae bacterium]
MKTTLHILLLAATSAALQANDLASILAPLTRPAASQSPGEAPAATRAQISEADLTAALTAELKSHLSLDGDLRLSLTQPWVPPSVPANAAWEVRILQTPSTGLASTALVRFRVDSAGERVGEWQVVVRAQLLRSVWSASSRVGHRQSLSSSNCQAVQVDVLREKQAPVPADTDLASYEATQSLSPNQLLTWKDISPRQAIRKGQVVEVLASEGAMNITMKGTAMTGGGVGQDIIVRNLDSRRDISARVMDSSKARVNF